MAASMLGSTPPPLRWGVLGTGRIVRRNWRAMRESGAAVLAAVASRDVSKARAFVSEMQAELPWASEPLAHGSYEALLADEGVEAVYVPLPTAVRKHWVIAAAEAGKHVLCEKPCAISADDLREMLAACSRNEVNFMDGVMFMHGRRFPAVVELLGSGEPVGEIRRISSSFTFRGSDGFAQSDIRGDLSLEPGGCLGDLGWYCLRAILWTMDWQLPTRVTGHTLVRTVSGAMLEFSGEVEYPGGVSASYHSSFLSPGQRWFNVAGTSNCLRVPDFVVPCPENDVEWEIGYERKLKGPEPGATDEALMFSRFAADVRSGRPLMDWPRISLLTQILQDACLLSDRLGRPVIFDANSGSSPEDATYT